MNTKKVLLPLDGSPFSRHMLPYVCQFIKPEETELLVLRVAPWPKDMRQHPVRISPINWLLPLDLDLRYTLPNAAPAFHANYASQETERVHVQILDELHDQTQALREAGYRITLAVEFGEPAEEIINVVEHRDIDLVAMATHGRSGLSHFVLGSVAEQVVRRVHVPVLLVRPEAHVEDTGAHTHSELSHIS